MQKPAKKHNVFHCFWASKAVQDSLGRPKKAPKRRLKSSKGFKKVDPKMEPILITFWITFGALLGPIRPKLAPEGDQEWDYFWNHVPPHLRGPRVAFSGIIREVCKGYRNWNYIYTLQKKGKDFLCFHGGLYPPGAPGFFILAVLAVAAIIIRCDVMSIDMYFSFRSCLRAFKNRVCVKCNWRWI